MNNESIASLMKMDLKGLTPNSFREGDSSMYAQFLKHSPPGTTSRMNNTVIKKSKKNTNTDIGVLIYSDKNLMMISEEDPGKDLHLDPGKRCLKNETAQRSCIAPERRRSVYLMS